MMQAIELETEIGTDGQMINIRLPQSCKQWFGNHAKLILILQESNYQEPSSNMSLQQYKKVQQQKIDKWRALLKETQALPSSQNICDADIEFEIEACRAGQYDLNCAGQSMSPNHKG
ncbi:MAG: hypothetical protein HQK67_05335 [Desulfamplus sp.]|nr:hypothetical protein [Desulfamplus sp.]